jgi:hypothetical protein
MSAKIVSYKDYVAGWLDSSIHDFLTVLSPSAASSRFALITCLDSNPAPAALLDKSPELKPLRRHAQVLQEGLLLPTATLLRIDARSQVFFGFDEIWFFPSRNIAPKPVGASLVGPGRLSQDRVRKLGKWLSDNTCTLAIGGGEGLNFIVRARGLLRLMLGYTIEQLDPALTSA